VSPQGWTRSYETVTMNNITRTKRNAEIVTGKILVTCKVTVDGLGTHSGTGEEWADEDNAMTSAEAQAFKRACSCFGLGRYFYDFDAPWVDIDEKGRSPARTQKSHPDRLAWSSGLSSGRLVPVRKFPSVFCRTGSAHSSEDACKVLLALEPAGHRHQLCCRRNRGQHLDAAAGTQEPQLFRKCSHLCDPGLRILVAFLGFFKEAAISFSDPFLAPGL
jgi:hypothetical protein